MGAQAALCPRRCATYWDRPLAPCVTVQVPGWRRSRSPSSRPHPAGPPPTRAPGGEARDTCRSLALSWAGPAVPAAPGVAAHTCACSGCAAGCLRSDSQQLLLLRLWACPWCCCGTATVPGARLPCSVTPGRDVPLGSGGGAGPSLYESLWVAVTHRVPRCLWYSGPCEVSPSSCAPGANRPVSPSQGCDPPRGPQAGGRWHAAPGGRGARGVAVGLEPGQCG